MVRPSREGPYHLAPYIRASLACLAGVALMIGASFTTITLTVLKARQ